MLFCMLCPIHICSIYVCHSSLRHDLTHASRCMSVLRVRLRARTHVWMSARLYAYVRLHVMYLNTIGYHDTRDAKSAGAEVARLRTWPVRGPF